MQGRFIPSSLIVVLALAGSTSAGQRQYDFQRRELKNGLTVITLEDRSCPIVAVQVWYHVGSKDEDPERQGFAHMFEHMMFRGTDVLGPEEHFSLIRRTGGDCNAFTAFDNTTYINELPSNQLELALWLEAERMAFLKVDDESFYKERAVVEEERRLRSLNAPYGTVLEKLLASLFTKHPYRWSPIGSIPHLRAATIDELQAFWDTFYVPNNATLVIVGDIQHDKAHALAEKYFGWIPRCPTPPKIKDREPPQTAARKLTIPEKKGPVPIVGYLFRAPPTGHPDELPLEMLMSVLGGGESSRIYVDLVKKQKTAQAGLAGAFALEDDGVAGAGAILMPWGNKNKILKTIRQHIEDLRKEPVTPRELEKVRNQLLREEVTKSLTVANKANLLGQYQTIERDAEKANRRLAEIRAVTADDLLRVARKYLTKENRTEVRVEPQFASMLGSLVSGSKEDDVDEGAAPTSKPAENRIARRGGVRAELKRPAGFPERPPTADLLESVPKVVTQETVLENGLKVVCVPNNEVPFTTITLGLLHGSWTEEKPGTAAMAAQLITKGSEKHSAEEMAEELEFNAISISGSATLDVASVSASCVSDKFDKAVELMAEVVRTPKFPKDEFEIARKQALLGLMISTRTPQYLADRELRRRVFGAHPYSRTSTGEPDDVRALGIDDVAGWWRTHVRPDLAVLYVAGDVQPGKAFETAKKYFGDWKVKEPKPEPKLAAVPAPSSTRIFLIDRPGSVQSEIRVGHAAITRNDPDYFKGLVLSQILGGGFNSRLNKAIRIDRGLTYGARGGLSADRFSGRFTASTFTKTPSTAEALKVILDEVDKLQASPADPSEVEDARSYLVGKFAGDRETPSATVGDLWLIEYCKLPKDYFDRYLSGVRKTTNDNVLDAANKLIRRDKLTIVVVGEAQKIKSDLEKIAPVEVIKSSEKDEKPSGDEAAAPDDKDDGDD